MSGWFKDKYSRIGYIRYKRILMYLHNFSEKVEVKDETDIKTLEEIKNLMNERVRAVRILYFLTNFSYFGIYFSFISIFLSDLIFLSDVNSVLTDIIGFFGTALFVILLFFSQRLSELYYEDLNLLASHAIAIYNNYEMPNGDTIFSEMNNYISFINFFKKRYD